MIDRLIEEIINKHRAYPPASDSLIAKSEMRVGHALPADLKRFYTRCNGAVLFGDEHAFSYRILPVQKIKRTRIYVFGADNDDDDDLAPASWYAVCDLMEGNYVGIDLASIAPDNKTCSIIDCFHETHGLPGQNKIIAKSFTEFLQRALGSEEPYWLQPGFAGYGEALDAKTG